MSPFADDEPIVGFRHWRWYEGRLYGNHTRMRWPKREPLQVEPPTEMGDRGIYAYDTDWRALNKWAKLRKLAKRPRVEVLREMAQGIELQDLREPALDAGIRVLRERARQARLSALRERAVQLALQSDVPRPVYVCGAVYLWGEVVEHERGYRAEFAYPKELWVPPDTEDEDALQLETAYGVPVKDVAWKVLKLYKNWLGVSLGDALKELLS